MGDIFTTKERSRIMSKIKGKDSQIELLVRRNLWKRGYRYRKHYGGYKIDIAFPREKVAVFIDSCFWHGCPKHGELPKTNVQFWKTKLTGNIKRDRKVDNELNREGWAVIRIWEHDIRSDLVKSVDKIVRTVEAGKH